MMKLIISITLIVSIFYNYCYAAQSVVNLDEDNWRVILANEWMVEFYAPWCPACKNLVSTWEEFSTWAEDVGVHTGKIDVTTSPALSGRFFVTALPTIFHVINGEFRQYRGPRDLESLKNFIRHKKWNDLEKVSEWKRPESIQMSILSYFFKLSHFLKELSNTLSKDYGIPYYGSYILFAITTILIGALLGLFSVCVIDFIFPSKTAHRQSFTPLEEDIHADELHDEEESSSEGEKYSGTDSDDDEDASENNKNISPKESPKASPTSSPDVRKRRTRKAD